MSSYFENRKAISFYVLCLNFSIEAKIKTLFLILHFNLSKKKKNEMALYVHGSVPFRFLDKLKCEIKMKLRHKT